MADKISPEKKSNYNTTGFFMITEYCKNKVENKRERRGLGELQKRQNPWVKQVLNNIIMFTVANTVVAPLERCRIILQTGHMINLKQGNVPTSTIGTYRYIIEKQGFVALWRGNNPKIYQNITNSFLRIMFFDRFKNYFMPYDVSKYSGLDYAWRSMASGGMCVGLSLLISYPLDLIHTRTSGDMSIKGTTRLYKTTFDCFNRTNLDETRNGLYKGFEAAITSSILRGMLTLPVYQFFKDKYPKNDESGLAKFYNKLGAACASGTLVSLIIYPLDTYKKTLQTNGGRGFYNKYGGSMDVFTKLHTHIGIQGMYRGAPLFAMANIITAFVQFQVYDSIVDLVQIKHKPT